MAVSQATKVREAEPTKKIVDSRAKKDKAVHSFTISELAQEFDITPRAIRFYEDQGLIAPQRKRAGGHRVYSARERTRLKLTLRGKRLGLSLSEIRDLVTMYDSPKDTQSQLKSFLDVLEKHQAALLQQREDIELMLAEMAVHYKECQRLLKSKFKRKPQISLFKSKSK